MESIKSHCCLRLRECDFLLARSCRSPVWSHAALSILPLLPPTPHGCCCILLYPFQPGLRGWSCRSRLQEMCVAKSNLVPSGPGVSEQPRFVDPGWTQASLGWGTLCARLEGKVRADRRAVKLMWQCCVHQFNQVAPQWKDKTRTRSGCARLHEFLRVL